MMRKLWCLAAFLWAVSVSAWAVVDINTASVSELQAVHGIGETKAKAIVEYRQKHGPFVKVDDLQLVKGFGPKTLDKLRSELTAGTPSRPAETKPAAPAATPATTPAKK